MALLLAPVVKMPVGQAVQLVAPAAAYVPAAHAVQPGVTPPAHPQEPSTLLRASVAMAPAKPAAHETAYEVAPPVATDGVANVLGNGARYEESSGCASATTSAVVSARL